MDTPLEQALPLRITVRDGDLAKRVLQAGQPPGVIELSGRALPKGSIVFEGTQRARAEWYPGNPEATIQAHGSTEGPTTVRGEWKDRYLGDGVSRAFAVLFEEIRRRAPALEVSWGAGVLAQDQALAIGDPFTRRGVLKRTRFEFERPTHCIWELEFLWSGLPEVVAAPVLATGLLAPAAQAVEVADSLSRLEAFAAVVLEFTQTKLVGAPAQVLAAVGDALAQVDAASDAIYQAGAAAQSAATVPAQALDQLVRSLGQGVDAARQLIVLFEDFPKVLTAVTDDAQAAYEMVANVLSVLGLARDALSKCAAARDDAAQGTTPDVIAEVRMPAGSDLRELAARPDIYGDADGWVEIANYNGFATSEVPAPPTGPSDTDYPAIKVPRRGLATGLGC